jgi:ATP-binding protein involved in chromosome partitioning
MSYFLCPHCGGRTDIFGHGGAEHEAERIGVPFLGAVPLHMKIREYSDEGTPVVAREPDGEHARIFRTIAERTWARVMAERAETTRQPPKIVME